MVAEERLAVQRRKKVITSTFSKEEADNGEYLTIFQIAIELGLAGFPDPASPERAEILKQARTYYDTATEVGGKFLAENTFLRTNQVLFIRRLLNVSCRKEWAQVATNSLEVKLWEHRARECKARRNFAIEQGLTLENTTVDMVKNSTYGFDHYADMAHVVSAAAIKSPKA